MLDTKKVYSILLEMMKNKTYENKFISNVNLQYSETLSQDDFEFTEGILYSDILVDETNPKIIEPADSGGVIDARFSYSRCVPKYSSLVLKGKIRHCTANDNNKAPQKQHNMTISFNHIGQFVAFRFCSWGNEYYRILIDGHPIREKFTLVEKQTTGLWGCMIKFSSIKTRLITLEIADSQFTGIIVGENDLIYEGKILSDINCIALGDSVTQGQSNDDSCYSIWCKYLSNYLNWNIMDEGEGGTGWINPGTLKPNRNFKGRLDTCVIPYNPDIVIFAGGLNDQTSVNSSYTSETRKQAIEDTILYLKQQLPNTIIICISPFFTSYNNTGEIAVNEDIKTVCNKLNIFFIDLQGYMTDECVTKFISSDIVHPLSEGHKFWAKILANKIYTHFIKG